MENATKALLIAGGILIAMITISIGVYLFISYSNVGSSYEQNMQSTEIQKFNANFTKFEQRKDITIQEIVSLANFAKQYEEQTEIHIKIILQGKDLNDNIDIVKLISDNSTSNEEIKHFRCADIQYENGIVKSIIFM